MGNKAFAEWVIEADHTGPLFLAEDAIWNQPAVDVDGGRRDGGRLPRGEDPVVPNVLRRPLADRADRRSLTDKGAMELHAEHDPDPLDVEFLETADPPRGVGCHGAR